jgi:hypothetical protein
LVEVVTLDLKESEGGCSQGRGGSD